MPQPAGCWARGACGPCSCCVSHSSAAGAARAAGGTEGALCRLRDCYGNWGEGEQTDEAKYQPGWEAFQGLV